MLELVLLASWVQHSTTGGGKRSWPFSSSGIGSRLYRSPTGAACTGRKLYQCFLGQKVVIEIDSTLDCDIWTGKHLNVVARLATFSQSIAWKRLEQDVRTMETQLRSLRSTSGFKHVFNHKMFKRLIFPNRFRLKDGKQNQPSSTSPVAGWRRAWDCWTSSTNDFHFAFSSCDLLR